MSNAQQKDNDVSNQEETMQFETDVFRLLDIVTNALYSNRDVFLRELISNSSDACDRLRYEGLQHKELVEKSAPFNIRISPSNNSQSIQIVDNGIGMNRADLIENLGTIARSGTAAIIENLRNSGQDKDMSLIGQFGVGFYASFMVSEKVEVISSKAGEDEAWYWQSNGQDGFTIREATQDEAATLKDGHGTAIILHVKGDAMDYLIEDNITRIILEYSDHVEIPIYMDDKFKEQKENRKIDVQLKYIYKELICTIKDNGIGIDIQKEHKNMHKKSLATTITSERLKMLSKDFKTNGSVTIENRQKYNEQGTIVTLIIPYKMNITS